MNSEWNGGNVVHYVGSCLASQLGYARRFYAFYVKTILSGGWPNEIKVTHVQPDTKLALKHRHRS